MIGFDPPRAKRIKEGGLSPFSERRGAGDLASVCHVDEESGKSAQKSHEI